MALPILTTEDSAALGYEHRTVWPFELRPEHPFFSGALFLRRAFTQDPAQILEGIAAEAKSLGVAFSVDQHSLEALRTREESGGLFRKKSALLEMRVEVNGIELGLFAAPERVEKSSAEVLSPYAMGGTADALERTRSIFVVTERGVEGETGLAVNFDRAAAVTLALNSIAKLTSPLAVFWERTQQAAPVERLVQGYKLLQDSRFPCELWARLLTVQPPPHCADLMPGLTSVGLVPFLGMEAEFLPGKLSRTEQVDLMNAALAVLVESEPKREITHELADGTLLTGQDVPEWTEDGGARYVLGDFEVLPRLQEDDD